MQENQCLTMRANEKPFTQAVSALGKLGLEGYFGVKALSPSARRLMFSHLES